MHRRFRAGRGFIRLPRRRGRVACFDLAINLKAITVATDTVARAWLNSFAYERGSWRCQAHTPSVTRS